MTQKLIVEWLPIEQYFEKLPTGDFARRPNSYALIPKAEYSTFPTVYHAGYYPETTRAYYDGENWMGISGDWSGECLYTTQPRLPSFRVVTPSHFLIGLDKPMEQVK